MEHLLEIKNLIFKSSIDEGLELATILIRDININNCYFLDLTDIEACLIDKISYLNNIVFKYENVIEDKPLFIISEGYSTGGHTRLMENLSLMVLNKSSLLITRPTQEDVIKKFERYFDDIATCFKESNNIEYIFELTRKILKYNKVILNTHPDDIFTIVACGLAKKLNKQLEFYFVNHADHLATYGVTVSDVWFELSLYGQILDQSRGLSPETQISFLGIPINQADSIFFESIVYKYNNDENIFLTAANGHKYKATQEKSIIPLLEKILTINPKNKVIVLGSGVDSESIFVSLKKKYPHMVSLYKSLPYEEYIKLTDISDFYIDSFPVPGGTAFVEQFIHGKACIGLETDFFGYTPLEVLKKNSVDKLINLIENPPSDKLINEIQLNIFEVHSFTRVKERFLSSLYEDCFFENPMLNYIKKRRVFKNYNFEISMELLKKIYNLDKIIFYRIFFSKKIITKIPKAIFKKIFLININIGLSEK